MPLSISQLKSRAAKGLYYKTMTLIYGIQSCAADYPDEQFQDDLIYIDLLSSGRDCRYLVEPPVHKLPHQPIILNFGSCVQLPISCSNT